MKGTKPIRVRTERIEPRGRIYGFDPESRGHRLQQPGKVDAALLELTCLRAPLRQRYPEASVK